MRVISPLKKELKRHNLDAIIASSLPNTTYLTKFPNPDAYVLAHARGLVYFTDSRYLEEAKGRLKGVALVKQINGSVFKAICQSSTELGLKRIGFEERHLPYAEYRKIKEFLGAGSCLVPSHGIIENLRLLKRAEEIDKIKKALSQLTKLPSSVKDKIEKLFAEATADLKKAHELKAELDKWNVYKDYEDRFLDLFRKAKDKGN